MKALNNSTCINRIAMKKLFILFVFICFSGIGQIYAAAAPAAADECAGATLLTVGASCTYSQYTNASATASSGVPVPGCANYVGGDVWFRLVVPASGHILLDSQTGGITDGGMALYTGACASLTLVTCNDDGSANGLMPLIDQTGLTPGATVYIRFWEYGGDVSGTFSICASDPPAPPNDNCTSATPLTVNANTLCGSVTPGTIAAATASAQVNGCFGTADDDVWYSFVATSTSHTIDLQNVAGSTTDLYHSVYSGTCGVPGAALVCSDPNSSSLTGLTIGNTYYVRVFSWTSTAGQTSTFDICIGTPPPPAPPNNQDCLGAIPICNSTYSTAIAYSGTGNITGEINSGTSCLLSGEKNDVWYVFTVINSGNLDFTINPVTNTDDYDWAVYNLTSNNCADIYSNTALEVSCNYSGSTTVYNNAACTGTTPGEQGNTGPNGYFVACNILNEAVVPVTAGQTYVINVSQFSTSVDGYQIDFGASTATIFDNVPPVFQSVATPISCGATTLTFNFSENVQCATATTADFTLTGPGGPYAITGITSAQCAAGATYDNTFTITVSPALTTSGSFQLCLVNTAGSVADICNNVAAPACFNFNINNIVLTPSQTNVTCNGGTNGVASVSVTSGGTAPYTYLWNDPAPAQTTATATGLTAGTYTVTVTDAMGCMAQATVTITQPAGMTLTTVPTNATCGASNGSINLTVAGGTAPYTYLWSNGATVQDPSGLAGGVSYTVTVTATGGCTATATQAITVTASPAATFTYNGNQCLTGNSYNFTNTGTSGGGATYSWTFPSGTPANSTQNNPNGVTWAAANTYTVSHTVTQGGCSTTVTQNIVVYPNPSVTTTPVNVNCNGLCNGSATASPSGGAGFTYVWSDPAPAQTTQTATALCAGNYTVTVTNSNGCTGTQTVAITQPAALSLSPSRTDALCNGVCNGTGNVSVTGGTGSYTYLWDNGQTTANSTGLCFGIHTVTVTDAANPSCTQTTTVNIGQPSAITLTPTPVNPSCGLSNGSASVAASGGTVPYTYLWSTGGTTNSISSLAAGSYTVTVTDFSGCTKTTTVNLSNTGAPTASISASANVNCNGGSTGSATVSAVGGAAPYTYSWSNAATTASVSGLTAGTYTVTVTDNNTCQSTASVTITQPAVLNANISAQTNNTCYGSTNGNATVFPSGGTAPYSYAWSTTPAQNGATANNLVAGTYTVTVTDNNGCTKTTTVTITAPAELTANITVHTDVTCFGGTNGSATVVATGGTPGYTYTWGPSGQTTATATNLPAGTYDVTVTDANGCVANASIPPTCFQIESILVDACFATEGEQEMVFFQVGPNALNTSSLGVGSVTWPSNSWLGVCTNPAFVANVNATITGGGQLVEPVGGVLPAGAQVVLITSTTQTTSFNSFANLSSTVYVIFQCAGNTAGHFANYNAASGIRTITINFGGGCSDVVSYDRANLVNQTGGSSAQDGASVYFNDAGTPSYVNNGCVVPFVETTVTIVQPAALTASVVGTNVLCNGGATGTATLTVTGGVTPYTYTWSNTATTQNLTGLAAGTYTVTVRDANNCTVTASVTITQPVLLAASVTGVNTTCNGAANGSANLTPSGGTAPYTFLWSNGAVTEDITGLAAGTYTVTVTDNNACTATSSVTITQPVALTASIAGTNLLCNGGTTGAANLTISGGSAPYSQTWSNGAMSEDLTNVIAGTYTVTVTDASLCTATASVTLTQPALLTATISASSNVSCNGSSDGSATVSAGGGTAPYTYLWTGGQTTATATNLASGSYTVTVTDFQGCTSTASANISQPAVLTAAIAGTNVLCNGGNTGIANLTVAGGTSPYTFIWSNTATTEDLNTLAAGTYSVTVTDNKLCTVTAGVTITQPAAISLTPSSTNATCGAANGTAGIAASGGTSPYTYLWTGGQTTASIIGLTAGAYSVTVTDASGCTATNTINVSNTGSPTASISAQTNVLCNASSTGSATVTAAGGTAPYTYLWTGGQTTATASNLAAGTYTVTVTDNLTCSTTATVTITQPVALTVSISGQTNINCNGGSNGSASASSAGGTSPYTYLWTGGQTTSTATGLTAGTYTVTVTDANLCSVNTSVTITQPVVLSATGTGTNVTCNGGNNGTATATPSGGTSPYTYVWQNLQTTQTATGLAAGTYNVTVTDANLCTATTSYIVTQPLAMTLTPGTVDATCGNPNGSASVAIAGGTAPYTYLWSTGGTGNSIAGIAAGAYGVTVTDANSCAQNITVNVNNLGAPTATLTITGNALCNGVCNGTADVSASGGTPPYVSYNWSNLASGVSVTGLCAGTISVTVTDNAGCSATASDVVTEPTAMTSLISAQTNVSCFGGNNGSATVSASGGTSPYTYLWQGGGSGAVNSPLAAGSYGVTVTDLNGCTTNTTATITEQADLTLGLSTQTDVLCNGGATGSATVVAGGGVGPYNYSWSNGATGATAPGLAASTYTITVTDANSCTETYVVTITEPAALSGVTGNTSETIFGLCDGTATATPSGGTAGYTYLWSDGAAQTTATATGLCVGSYTVTITDANGCTVVLPVNILGPGALNLIVTGSAVNCNGDCTGTASVVVSGGVSPYTFLWDAGAQTNDTATGLCAGTYTVTVTDANLATANASAVVTQPVVLTSAISSQVNIICNGGNNGSASVTASGGTLPYSYNWTGGSTASGITNLTAGTYTVTVTDANLCTSSVPVTITEPLAVTATATGTDAACNGGSTGSASVTATGGTGAITFSWSNGASGATASGLAAGSYTVTATDVGGCTGTDVIIINEPVVLTGFTGSTSETVFGLCDGTATATPSGGTAIYTYLWSDGAAQTTATATGLCVGSYTVTITDANGCTVILPVNVTGPGALNMTVTGSAVNCNGDCTGTANVNVTGGISPYTYLWNTGAQTNDTATGLCAGTYTVTVTDSNGATANASTIVTQPAALTSLISSQTNVNCFGGNTGSASVSPSGGTLPYTYLWTGGGTISTASNLAAGIYDVTVTDNNLCTSVSSVTITEAAVLTAVTSGIDVNCNGGADGSATVTAGGGSPSYSYLWSNGSTGASATGLTSGNFTVTVTDIYSCTVTGSVTIAQPSALGAAILSSTDVTGFGASDGSATASGTNGSSPYTYDWSNGATGAVANNLTSGTYTVTVTDANVCTATTTVTINEPGALVVSLVSSTDVTCNGQCNGDAVISASGGTTPYSYLWSSGGSTATVTGLCSGTHTVTVTDANGYTGSISVVINQPSLLTGAVTSNIAVACNGGTNGSASITAGGGTTPYTYLWSNSEISSTISNVQAGNYSVTITDSLLCTAIVNVTVTEPLVLTVAVNALGANCGQPQGSLQAIPAGGTAPYTYLWSSSQTTQSAMNLVPGTYQVTVTDDNGCTANGSGVISNIPGVTLTVKFTTNTTCFGDCDGSAMLESAGGLAPYSYSGPNGFSLTTVSVNASVPGLCAGTYTFSVTDANGCQSTFTDTVFEPAQVVASILTSSNVLCNSGNTGTATASVSGGTFPYTVLWSTTPAQDSLFADNLTAGTYTVTVFDRFGCEDDTSITITQPTTIQLTTGSVTAHCGQSDGSASVSASGGTVTSGYSYLWTGGVTTNQATGLSASGSPYSVTVTDNNGCIATGSVTVPDAPPGTATISGVTNISCNGLSDGTATVSMGGGQPPFLYSWTTTPVQTNVTATNLPAGSYTVSVTDNYNCTVTTTATITQPNVLANNFTQTNAPCFGSCSGVLAAGPTGGTTPYEFSWNTTDTSQTVSNLCAGNYSLTITDANGCNGTYTATITQPAQIVITGVENDAHCNNNDGSVSVTVTGGMMGYSYLWSNGQLTDNCLNVIAGAYTVTVTDGAGCTASATFNVNNISGPTAVIDSSSGVSCFGAGDGFASVLATPAPGMPPVFTYLWNTSQVTATITNLGPGVYSVTVTDSSGCVASVSVNISEPAALSFIVIKNDPTCYGACDGNASVLPSGGTQPYTYFWTSGGPNQYDSSNTALCDGQYQIVVNDAHNCQFMQNVMINQPPFMSVISTPTPQTCSDICDGKDSAFVTGGTPPYSYIWNNSQSTSIATGLCAGPYTVTVTDANGCVESSTSTVTKPSAVQIQLVNLTHVACNGQSSGRIIIGPTGGTPGYNYIWSNSSTSQNQINIPFGNYCVTVSDQRSCLADTCFVVSQPPLLQVSLSATNETCYGFCDGTMTPAVTGGQSPYTYLWSNFSSTSFADSLCPGPYNLTVTDNNNCTASASSVVNGYSILDLVLVHVDTATCGQANGYAEISVIGGSNNYSYNWPPPANSISNSASNLTAGIYTVTVTDDHQCTATLDINISNADGPVIDSISVQHITCFGDCDGSLQVFYHGSTVSYEIEWNTNPQQTSAIASGLCPGMYSVLIRDDNNCITSANRVITQPPLLQSAVTNHTNATCYGTCNGSAMAQVNGGVSPYIYYWSDGTIGNTTDSACAGNFTVTVYDANNCSSQSSVTITQPDAIQISATVQNVLCNGQDNGQISAVVTGGTGFNYNWFPNVGSGSVVAPLAPNTYTLIVSDYSDLNCTATGTYVISEPDPISISTIVEPTKCGLSNGSVVIPGGPNGGTSPFSYNWSPGNSVNDTLLNASSGTYQLQVTDDNNCTAIFAIPVPAIQPPVILNLTKTDVSCKDSINGSVTINMKFGSTPFYYTWTPSIGSQTIIDTSSTSLNNLDAGIYSVTITDANGCPVHTSFIINEPSVVNVFADGAKWVCGGQPATLTSSASGGTPGYTFNWTGTPTPTGQIQQVNPVATTYYHVIAIDSRGCLSDTASVLVNVFPPVTVTLTATSDSICKDTPVDLYAVAAGGNNGPYTYDWQAIYHGVPIQNFSTDTSYYSVTPNDTTMYIVHAQDNCNSPSEGDTVTLIVWPKPFTIIVPNTSRGCKPLKVYFNTTPTSDSLHWDFGDLNSSSESSPIHIFEEEGTYDVLLSVTSSHGCASSDNHVVEVYPIPDAEFYADPNVVSLFHSTVSFVDQTENSSYWFWNFGDKHFSSLQNPEHSYDHADTFQVTLLVKNIHGCTDSVTHPVVVYQEHTFYAPTAFDPNSMFGPEFNPQGTGIDERNYHLWVYDRWGQIVFETSDLFEHWNGKFQNKGDYVKSGTFSWVVKLKDVSGKWHEYVGSVTVIR